MNDKNTLTHTS